MPQMLNFRPKKGSSLVRPVKAQKALGAKVGLKENTDRSTIRRHPTSQRSADDSHSDGRILGTTIHEQPAGTISLVQQSGKALKPPRLNISTCQATIPLDICRIWRKSGRQCPDFSIISCCGKACCS